MKARLVAAAALLAAGAVPAIAEELGASFFDDFSAEQLDRTRWYISDGWSNGPHQSCAWSSANLRKEGERVLLIVDDEARLDLNYSCAELQSTAYYHYGIFEARVRAGRGAGVVSGFFTYTGPPHGNPHDEIDFEWAGARPNSVELNEWRDGVPTSDRREHPIGIDMTAEFHHYAFEWRPDALRWFLDGKLLREVTDPDRIPREPGKLYFSIFTGAAPLEEWLGRFEYPGEPIVMEVDFAAYTALGEECQFPESIVCGSRP